MRNFYRYYFFLSLVLYVYSLTKTFYFNLSLISQNDTELIFNVDNENSDPAEDKKEKENNVEDEEESRSTIKEFSEIEGLSFIIKNKTFVFSFITEFHILPDIQISSPPPENNFI